MIGAGGGGIPVVRTEAGDYQSVDAVIDKDLSTALLAREIPRRHSGDHHRRRKSLYPLWQAAATGARSRRYCHHDPLYAGRAFPTWQHVAKIIASLTFLEQDGKEVIITTPECLPAALRGETAPILLKPKDVR